MFPVHPHQPVGDPRVDPHGIVQRHHPEVHRIDVDPPGSETLHVFPSDPLHNLLPLTLHLLLLRLLPEPPAVLRHVNGEALSVPVFRQERMRVCVGFVRAQILRNKEKQVPVRILLFLDIDLHVPLPPLFRDFAGDLPSRRLLVLCSHFFEDVTVQHLRGAEGLLGDPEVVPERAVEFPAVPAVPVCVGAEKFVEGHRILRREPAEDLHIEPDVPDRGAFRLHLLKHRLKRAAEREHDHDVPSFILHAYVVQVRHCSRYDAFEAFPVRVVMENVVSHGLFGERHDVLFEFFHVPAFVADRGRYFAQGRDVVGHIFPLGVFEIEHKLSRADPPFVGDLLQSGVYLQTPVVPPYEVVEQLYVRFVQVRPVYVYQRNGFGHHRFDLLYLCHRNTPERFDFSVPEGIKVRKYVHKWLIFTDIKRFSVGTVIGAGGRSPLSRGFGEAAVILCTYFLTPEVSEAAGKPQFRAFGWLSVLSATLLRRRPAKVAGHEYGVLRALKR